MSSPTGTFSRCSRSVGPLYQAIVSAAVTTLSPCTAEIGMAVTSLRSSRPANSRYASSIRANTSRRVADEIHLVDGEHDPFNAQKRKQVCVAPGLRQNSFSSVDQDYRQIGGRGSRDHVAGVLFMTGCIRHDELALFRREVAIGHIDSDTLLTFGRETVDEQREVEVAASCPHSL